MIKLTKAVLVGGAAAAIGVVAAASAFAAAPTFHITAGSKTSGTIAYTGKTTGNPGIHFTDKNTSLATTCQSGSAAGSMKLGKAVSGTKAGTITKTVWNTCQAAAGLTLTPKQAGTWYLNGLARPKNGVTKVSISKVLAHVSTSLPGCSFDVVGTATGTYTNSSGKLTVNSASSGSQVLKAENVKSCLGEVNNNDILIFKASYTVVTANKSKIKIS